MTRSETYDIALILEVFAFFQFLIKKEKWFNKRGFLLLLLIILSQRGFSQINITGEVLAFSGKPQPYANVLLLLNRDSSLVKGAVCDEQGSFVLEKINQGAYLIAISMVGLGTTYSSPFAINAQKDYDIGEIMFEQTSAYFEEILVTAKKPLFEQQIDRIVINIHNSITSAGGNVLEILARSPGVSLNEINNTLSLHGKQGVLIMIDGKYSRIPEAALMEMLRSMDANGIEKIELYDIPPARFDAEGQGGMINIIMKKNHGTGTNGTYSLNAAYGRRAKFGGSANLNYRKGRMNWYGNYTNRNNFADRRHYFNRTVDQMGQLITTDSKNPNLIRFLYNSLRLGVDYDLSDKTILGFLTSGYIRKGGAEASNISDFSTEGDIFSRIRTEKREDYSWMQALFNFNIQHDFTKGERINFDIDFLMYENENPSNYFNEFLDGAQDLLSTSEVRINNNSPINNFSMKLDYSKKINDEIQFQIGTKGTQSLFSNTINVEDKENNEFVKNESFSQNYEVAEDIFAAYSSLRFTINESLRLNVGLRYEHTNYLLGTENDPEFLNRNFGYFFPSVFFSKAFNELHRLQVSYSRRITRPAFKELAPFVTFIDPNTFLKGNPELVPGISNTFKIDYRFKNILLSAQYYFVQDPIVTYQPILDVETNTQFYASLNLAEEHTAALSLAIPVYPFKWWEVQNKAFGAINKIVIDTDNNTLSNKSLTLDMVHVFALPHDFAIELAGQYKTPSFHGLLKVQSRGFVNIGLQKKMAKNNGMLRLSVTDIFRTNVWSSVTNIPAFNLDSTFEVDIETRVVRLTYSSSFGNAKVKKSRKRTTSSEEERRRME